MPTAFDDKDYIRITIKDHGDAEKEGSNPSRFKATAKKGETLIGFGTGRTVDAAIGDVVRANPKHFNVRIFGPGIIGGLHKGDLNVFIGPSS